MEQEVKDQQEAMDALMDMLEKTITLEDTQDYLEELENRVNQRIDSEHENFAEIAEDVHGMHDKLESSAEHIVKTCTASTSELSEQISRVETQLRDTALAAEEATRVLSAQVDAKLGQLDRKCEAGNSAMMATLSGVDEGLRRDVDKVGKSCLGKLDDVTAGLDSAVSHMNASLDATVGKLRAEMNRSASFLSGKLSTEMEAMSTKLSAAVQTLDAKATATADTSEASLRRAVATAESRRVDLRTRLSAELAHIKRDTDSNFELVNAKVDDTEQKFRDRLAVDLKHVEDCVQRIDDKISDTSDALQGRLDKQRTDFEERDAPTQKRITDLWQEVELRNKVLTQEFQQFVLRAPPLPPHPRLLGRGSSVRCCEG